MPAVSPVDAVGAVESRFRSRWWRRRICGEDGGESMSTAREDSGMGSMERRL